MIFEEDIQLKSNKWSGKYDGNHVVFHNTTGIPFMKPMESNSNICLERVCDIWLGYVIQSKFAYRLLM